MEHIRKHVVLFYVALLFHHRLLPVNSELQRNSSHTDRARTMVSTSSEVVGVSVNRRGGGGGHGGGHSGGHAGGMGMHGSGNGEHSNSPHTLASGAIPLYGAAGVLHRNNYNHHHATSNNGILNYVCFYHYLVLFISIATGISL